MKEKKKSPLAGAVFGTILCVGVIFLTFGVVSNLGIYVQSLFVKSYAPKTFPWTAYDNMLHKYVRAGMVDYAGLKGSKELQAALDELAATKPDNLSDAEKGCYWLNADNLLLLKLICDRYPIQKVDELGYDSGTKSFLVGGKIMTHKEIDQDIIMNDYIDGNWKVLFSRFTGQKGAPALTSHAFVPETLESDLDENVRKFVLRRDTWRNEPDMSTVHLSEWYKLYRHQLDEHFNPASILNAVVPATDQIENGTLMVFNVVCNRQLNDLGELKKKGLALPPPDPEPSKSARSDDKLEPDSTSMDSAKAATDSVDKTEAKASSTETNAAGKAVPPPVPKVSVITVPATEKGK